MPRLTPENLEQLAREARLHFYGGRCATEPKDLATIEARRPAMTNSRPFLHVFGPETSTGAAAAYRHVHATGLMDSLVYENIYTPDDQRPINSIERQLREALAEYPPERGFDLVAVLHGPARDVSELSQVRRHQEGRGRGRVLQASGAVCIRLSCASPGASSSCRSSCSLLFF
jgi:hypothetical protein